MNQYISKGVIDRLKLLINQSWKRITFKQAKKLLKKENCNQDLSSQDENNLTEKLGCPVFVTNWPQEIKSFYMKQSDDGTCQSFDLLIPSIGELIGGSQREESYDKLLSKMEQLKIKREPLEFYLDLRKYGTVEHGGFGLGMDRLLMLLTGMKSIKDVIPFPVYYKNCSY